MNEAAKELLQDEEYIYDELSRIREKFGLVTTTYKEYEIIFRVLWAMRMYCPEKLIYMVDSTRQEAERRCAYSLMIVKQERNR